GPFDAALVQIGAYSAAWPDVHMTPEEGVTAHTDVRGGLLIPVHWGTFQLALHRWSDPVDRVWAAAKATGVPIAVPRPGERVDVAAPEPVEPWWEAVQYRVLLGIPESPVASRHDYSPFPCRRVDRTEVPGS